VKEPDLFLLLADAVLVIHFLLVLFVIFGMVAIVCGRLRGWTWIYGRTFRISHLIVIAIVVAQAWLGRLCPLTALESDLRLKSGHSGYSESFIAHWLRQMLFYDAEAWVFTAIYSVFGALVLIFWVIDRGRSR
jgi:hypothetical protein